MHEPSQTRCGTKHAHCTPEKVSMIVGTFERNRVRFLMGCPVGPRSPMAHWSKSTTSTPSIAIKLCTVGAFQLVVPTGCSNTTPVYISIALYNTSLHIPATRLHRGCVLQLFLLSNDAYSHSVFLNARCMVVLPSRHTVCGSAVHASFEHGP